MFPHFFNWVVFIHTLHSCVYVLYLSWVSYVHIHLYTHTHICHLHTYIHIYILESLLAGERLLLPRLVHSYRQQQTPLERVTHILISRSWDGSQFLHHCVIPRTRYIPSFVLTCSMHRFIEMLISLAILQQVHLGSSRRCLKRCYADETHPLQ